MLYLGNIMASKAEKFAQSLKDLNLIVEGDKAKLPSVVDWHPSVAGDIDIRINRDGVWFYQDEEMTRKAMVKLFSSILRLDSDEQYYLVSPVEKMRITVDVAPFSVVDLRLTSVEGKQSIIFKTNIDEDVLLKDPKQFVVDKNEKDEPIPLLTVRKNLKGLLSRNVFYQLADLAELHKVGGIEYLGVWSCGEFYPVDLASST